MFTSTSRACVEILFKICRPRKQARKSSVWLIKISVREMASFQIGLSAGGLSNARTSVSHTTIGKSGATALGKRNKNLRAPLTSSPPCHIRRTDNRNRAIDAFSVWHEAWSADLSVLIKCIRTIGQISCSRFSFATATSIRRCKLNNREAREGGASMSTRISPRKSETSSSSAKFTGESTNRSSSGSKCVSEPPQATMIPRTKATRVRSGSSFDLDTSPPSLVVSIRTRD
mmetsp:Transcript_13872/g.26932  ORF Transcript_13872/g.26932 Transcript_13872/m.26932 type:complete len:230 (-) Transcript_13872:881-1570(-)